MQHSTSPRSAPSSVRAFKAVVKARIKAQNPRAVVFWTEARAITFPTGMRGFYGEGTANGQSFTATCSPYRLDVRPLPMIGLIPLPLEARILFAESFMREELQADPELEDYCTLASRAAADWSCTPFELDQMHDLFEEWLTETDDLHNLLDWAF